MSTTKKILYDKIQEREVRHLYFFDQYGDCYIDTDPYNVNMDGLVRARYVGDDHPQYEVREIKIESDDKKD
jgi:hypothetical protein